MTENAPDRPEEEKTDVDELEQALLNAMKSLGRKNKEIEEYLQGMTRTTEKPANENETASDT